MRPRQQWRYWLLTGALIGFGWSAILSIGLPFALLGIAMLFVGMVKVGPKGFWGALVGFSGVPALLMLRIYFFEPRCPPPGERMFPPDAPAGLVYECSQVPESYFSEGIFFLGIAFAGLAWAQIEWLKDRTPSPN